MENVAELVSGKTKQNKAIQHFIFYLALHLQKGDWLQHLTFLPDIFLAFEASY